MWKCTTFNFIERWTKFERKNFSQVDRTRDWIRGRRKEDLNGPWNNNQFQRSRPKKYHKHRNSKLMPSKTKGTPCEIVARSGNHTRNWPESFNFVRNSIEIERPSLIGLRVFVNRGLGGDLTEWVSHWMAGRASKHDRHDSRLQNSEI
jgi:hypothetical protein